MSVDRNTTCSVLLVAIGVLGITCTGCQTFQQQPSCISQPNQMPRELQKVSLPEYVVEPPDILLIEAADTLRPPETPLQSGDTLLIQVAGTMPVDPLEDAVAQQFKQINGLYRIRTDGLIDFGPEYGNVAIAGLSVQQAQAAIEDHLKGILTDPHVSVTLPHPEAKQQIAGEHLVRPDGTVSLGIYGSVFLAGADLPEAKQRLEDHLSQYIHSPEVNLDVLAYNSKVYYVVTDGAGAGEQVFRFPCTGNETILDALAQINGLPVVSSKKHIWIARPAPPEVGHDQILSVDWDAIVRGGATETNYQIFPGDRVYVKADDLIVLDTFVAKITAPFERILGFILLGNGTVRAIQNGHRLSTSGGGY